MAVSQRITFGHRLEALGFDAYLGLFGALGPRRAAAWGAGVMRLLGPLSGAHQTALRNLRLAYPGESEAWRAEIASAMWAEFGRTTGEFPHLAAFKTAAKGGQIEVVGEENLKRAGETGAVFAAGHFSNWEVTALALANSAITCHITYRQANNPIIDKRIVEGRRKYGVRLQAAKGREGGMGLLRALARKETVALMNDQKYNEGVAAPLFGHDCMTADGPTRLALRFRVPLIPLSQRRIGPQRFRVTIHEPFALVYDAPAEEEVPRVVRAVNAFMEARIREAPEQWFWMHKRWPDSAWRESGAA